MRFTAKLVQAAGKNAYGVVVPAEVVAALGTGKRPRVSITINGYSYRTTIAVMGGDFMFGVAAEHRQNAGLSGGETIEVQIELDSSPRNVDTPADLCTALEAAGVSAAFAALAFSHRKEHVRSVNEAKTAVTRLRRIQAVIDKCGG